MRAGLLSALSLLQATPPTAWLHRLDIALLAYCADSDNLRFDASALQPSVCGQALELALRVQQQQAQQVKLQAQGAADAGSSGRGGGGTEAGVGGSSGGGRSLPGAPMATRLSPGAAWTAPPPLFPLLIEAGLMEQGLLLLPEQDGQGTSAGAGAGAGAGRTAPAAPSGTTPSSTSTSTSTPLATSPSHAQDWADLLPGVEAFHQLLQAGEPPLWRRYLARRDLPWQMLGPLLRRYGDNMGMQEVAAVARVAVMAIDEQCMAGGCSCACMPCRARARPCQLPLLHRAAVCFWRGQGVFMACLLLYRVCCLSHHVTDTVCLTEHVAQVAWALRRLRPT